MALLTDRRGARYVGAELPFTVIAAGSPSGSARRTAARPAASSPAAWLDSLLALRRIRPAAAAAFGGYASVPAALAAAASRVPLLVHEQNAVFGRANRLTARFARDRGAQLRAHRRRACPTPRQRRLVTGNPTRPEFAAR